jgi:hypothetical protein
VPATSDVTAFVLMADLVRARALHELALGLAVVDEDPGARRS